MAGARLPQGDLLAVHAPRAAARAGARARSWRRSWRSLAADRAAAVDPLARAARLSPGRRPAAAAGEADEGAGRARDRRVHAGLHPARVLRRRQRRDAARAVGRGLGGPLAPLAALLRRAAAALRASRTRRSALARETIAAYEGFDAIVANVAGCGSAMKDYGHLLADDPEWGERAKAFSAKVVDVHELLAAHEPQAVRQPIELRAAYHDACHLAHAQRRPRCSRASCCAASPGLELLEPAEWELCCGSAGIYNLLQPEAAGKLGARKAENLRATGADAIAAANPGCALQIAASPRPPDLSPDDPARHVALRGVHREQSARPPRPRDERAPRSCPTTRSPSSASCRSASAPRRAELLPRARASAARRRGFLEETRGDPRGRLAGPAAAARLREPARRDHRPDRPQARHQRAQQRRQGLHGRLRGRELADVAQPGRGPREPDRRDRGHDHLRRLRRPHYELDRQPRHAAGAPARLAPAREAPARSTASRRRRVHGLRALRLPQRPSGSPSATAASTSTCRRWSTTSRRRCGTTSSPSPARRSALPPGLIRATVLIETLPAAFQMAEIIHALGEHSYGLNAGRWDYIFSMIKVFRDDPDFVLPDRNDVKMTVPFMRAYTELLVKTCHAPRRVRDGRHGRADPLAQGRGGQRSARSRPSRRTRSARPRPASTAPGSRTPTSSTSPWTRSTRCSATARTRSTSSATTSTSRPSSCSTPPPPRARSPRRACAATSTSASSTSRSGSAAAAPRASTT